jgi:hypothetical protein
VYPFLGAVLGGQSVSVNIDTNRLQREAYTTGLPPTNKHKAMLLITAPVYKDAVHKGQDNHLTASEEIDRPYPGSSLPSLYQPVRRRRTAVFLQDGTRHETTHKAGLPWKVQRDLGKKQPPKVHRPLLPHRRHHGAPVGWHSTICRQTVQKVVVRCLSTLLALNQGHLTAVHALHSTIKDVGVDGVTPPSRGGRSRGSPSWGRVVWVSRVPTLGLCPKL